jgi:ABC-type antimicrobial peptide transport system permease subunit
VIVIDERLARRFWPGESALGRRMWRPTSAEEINDPEKGDHFHIVGIVESIQERSLTSHRDADGAYYFPLEQSPSRRLNFAIKTRGDTRASYGTLREAVAGLDPELPLFDVHTMNERVDRSLAGRRASMMLTIGFGAVALLLAAVGIYGVLAYLVQLRTREIGIRVALGSVPSGILRLVLRDGVWLMIAGLALGVAGAAGLRRLIESQLHGVSSLDPTVLALVVVLLGSVSLAASAIPALRATRIDVARALSHE